MKESERKGRTGAVRDALLTGVSAYPLRESSSEMYFDIQTFIKIYS